MKCWGELKLNQLIWDTPQVIDFGSNFVVSQVKMGFSHVCAVSVNHTMKCFGDNDYGQLGMSFIYCFVCCLWLPLCSSI